jgi:hypothetical protein
MKIITILLALGFLQSAFSLEDASEIPGKTSFYFTREVQKKIEEIKSIKGSEYNKAIDSYREVIEQFVEYKNKICSGEYSVLILENSELKEKVDTLDTGVTESSGKSKTRPKKLTRVERKLCFQELKALQINYINNSYVAKKSYLSYLHKKRLEELQDVKEDKIKDLKKYFSKF